MRIVFAGTPEFALPALRALVASAHKIVGVLTQPDRPAGRGQRLTFGPVKAFALRSGLPVAQPPSLRTADGRASLLQWSPDVLVVVAYGLILPAEALAAPRLGCLNIHASLLPRWRGAAPIQRALLTGDAHTGVTIMQMNHGLDTGPILAARMLEIAPRMNSGELSAALASLGAETLLEVLQDLEQGRAQPLAQPTTGISYAAKISKSEAWIDWSRSAQQIEWQVRAFNPWPMATTHLQGEPLRVHRAAAIADVAVPVTCAIHAPPGMRAPPGTVLGLDANHALRVACGAGELAAELLQRPGRRPVSARELANGTSIVGARLQ